MSRSARILSDLHSHWRESFKRACYRSMACWLLALAGCQAPNAKPDWLTTTLPSPQQLLHSPEQLAAIEGRELKSEVPSKVPAGDSDVDHDPAASDGKVTWGTFFRPHAKPLQQAGEQPKVDLHADDPHATAESDLADKSAGSPAIPPLPESVASAVLPADDIRLDNLESIALERHPSLSEYRSRVASASGQRLQAGLPYNPTLQYQSDEIGNDDSTGIHSLNVSQRFVTGGKLALAQRVQSHAVNQRQSEFQRQVLRVRTNVQVKFAQALVAQQRVDLALQIHSLAEKSFETVTELVQAGEVSRVALLQSQVEAQQAKLSADNANLKLAGARRQLAAAVSMDKLPDSRLVGSVSDGLDDKPWETLLSQLLASSPELAAAGSQLMRAQQALHLACAQNVPDITGQVGLGVDTASDDTFAMLGVSVPLPIRNRNQGNIHSARADIAVANASLTRIELDLSGRLADAVARYQVSKQRYERLQQEVLPLADEALQLSLEAFRAGETNYLELLTAQRSLFATRLNALESLAQAKQAMSEINGQLVTIQ